MSLPLSDASLYSFIAKASTFFNNSEDLLFPKDDPSSCSYSVQSDDNEELEFIDMEVVNRQSRLGKGISHHRVILLSGSSENIRQPLFVLNNINVLSFVDYD